jgi:hypothetical protein
MPHKLADYADHTTFRQPFLAFGAPRSSRRFTSGRARARRPRRSRRAWWNRGSGARQWAFETYSRLQSGPDISGCQHRDRLALTGHRKPHWTTVTRLDLPPCLAVLPWRHPAGLRGRTRTVGKEGSLELPSPGTDDIRFPRRTTALGRYCPTPWDESPATPDPGGSCAVAPLHVLSVSPRAEESRGAEPGTQWRMSLAARAIHPSDHSC